MKIKPIWIAAVLCLWSAGSFAQTRHAVYSWVDANGARHYSDRQPVGSQITPIKVKVSQPSGNGGAAQAVATVATRPIAPTEAEKAAQEKQQRDRAEDCEVARNNLKLLDDPKAQVVEKGVDGAKPMDNTARIEARVLAERQVQDFCR